MSIRINATVQEARTAANHSQEQWDRFYFITKDEARQLAEAHPDWKRWILIPANEKEQMLERINARLRAEGIPPVEMIILKWRVSQLLRDIQRKYEAGTMLQGMPGTSSGSGSGSPIQVQTTQPPSDSSLQSSSPQRSEYSPSEIRPYDPIRDV
ncbi:hypothetical protein A1F94_005720 [Pyrenophora tritici-repentis]|uniref:Uncharacterized protein n=1 Tax=Pyrenophora tritici-repentis TaxID=45151 RepID=A0A2W1EZR4_9PLEO|nr:hypothetical protein PtrV1_08208 [Pyrenophora tritici-repentis]KAF7449249.1 hypothetical protein A1F99_062980 [Pyrenophora tritici-repentis]KAF7570743.1 hypothetical protein PtrM4_107450 [Pyrenophora tritici-repentis]KAG9383809.1 hypothetical protein A1F94_005720 [Pyrenophora tritici-repentis]KAI0586616.1 hypothetical protein Alg215_01918 [Pyrenophora tritici-repentis]